MSLDTCLADKPDIHALTALPRQEAAHTRARTLRMTSPPIQQIHSTAPKWPQARP
jgi:hypothetical protein